MKFYYKVFLLLFILFIPLLHVKARESSLSYLLKEYQEAEARKTLDKTLGKAFIFSRQDLENLQIYTLADLLRFLPAGYVFPNSFGVNQYTYTRLSPTSIVYAIRIYFDGHELSSVHTNSPFLTYDNFPLDNVDKAEVYVTFSPSKTSTENGLLIIKLYSKDPKKENVTTLKGLVDSKKSYLTSFTDARQISKDIGYFLLLNTGENKFSQPEVRGNKLNRNQKRKHFYIKFNYIDTIFQFSVSDVKRGLFSGFSSDFSPEYGNIRSTDIFIVLSQKLLNDKSLKIYFSYDKQYRNYVEANKEGVLYAPYIKFTPLPVYPVYLDEYRVFSKLEFNIKKDFKFDNNRLQLSLLYSDYNQSAEMKKGVYQDKSVLFNYEPNYEEYLNIYGLYIGYKKYLSKSLNFIAEGKVSSYEYQKNKNFSTFDKKLGFIYTNTKNNFKILVSEISIIPSLILMENSTGSLKPINNKYLFVEDTYNLEKFGKISLVFSYAAVKNVIHPFRGKYVNDPDKYYGKFYMFDYKKDYNFLILSLSGWLADFDYPEYSPSKGINFVTYGNYKSFNYFTALFYRSRYEAFGIKVDDSYDVSLGIGYNYQNSWNLKLRADNILNSAPKAVYYRPPFKGTYSSTDRRFILAIEKVF